MTGTYLVTAIGGGGGGAVAGAIAGTPGGPPGMIAGAIAGIAVGEMAAQTLGAAFNALTNTVKALDNSFMQMAKDAAQYNPQVAFAEAQAEVADMFAQMRRAESLGPDLTDFIEARSDLMVDIQDLVTNIAPLFVRFMTVLMRGVDVIVEWLVKLSEKMDKFVEIIMGTNTLLVGAISPATGALLE